MTASNEKPREEGTTVSLGQSLARSKRFDDLFAEGMKLVEEAASYLDGPGRTQASTLRTGLKGAYAAESMRLTTRLMQIASWLLIRRAITEGEITAERAGRDRGRLDLTAQQLVSAPAIFTQLPADFRDLAERSLRLQSRVLHLDRMVNAASAPAPAPVATGLDEQFAMLRSAFATGG
jgi:regulator of CtrA degradation